MFRWWLGVLQPISQYLKQWWPSSLMHIYVTKPFVYLLIKSCSWHAPKLEKLKTKDNHWRSSNIFIFEAQIIELSFKRIRWLFWMDEMWKQMSSYTDSKLNANHERMASYVWRICHYDVIKWTHFPRYWPFVRGIHLSPMNSPHKGQWRGALMFCLICALNKRLSTQSWGWWFETPSVLLWRHCNGVRWPHWIIGSAHGAR